jgi:hypothetical protein
LIQLDLLPASSNGEASFNVMLGFMAFHQTVPVLLWGKGNEMIVWQYLVPGQQHLNNLKELNDTKFLYRLGSYSRLQLPSPKADFLYMGAIFVALDKAQDSSMKYCPAVDRNCIVSQTQRCFRPAAFPVQD